ncbi:MAG: SurA N-terminal domain-containing protein [Elusimicrobiaceae bacterium]|nr:SurA N-terminal domain-containing protein [Elusimicrobiaceae bacterium]
MIKTNKILAVLFAVALSTGVQAKVMESSVATVNGQPILASEYDSFLESVVEQYQASAPQVLTRPYAKDVLGKEVLKELISKELVYQASQEAKITVKDSELDEGLNEIKSRFVIDEKTGQPDQKGAEKRFSEALKKQGMTLKTYKAKLSKEIASRKLMEQELQKTIKPVEEADAKALFDEVQVVLKNNTKKIKEMEKQDPQHLQEVQAIAAKLKQLSAEQVRIGHIYLATTKDMPAAEVAKKAQLAQQIKKELDGGMDFSTAVKNYTEDKQALAAGGDMILIKGMAPKEIDAKAFTLAVGKVSDPIKTDVGYHIIKVKEKRAERNIGFDEIKNDLGQYIAQTRILEAQAKYLESLANKADIKITKEFEMDKALAAEEAKQETVKAEPQKETKK